MDTKELMFVVEGDYHQTLDTENEIISRHEKPKCALLAGTKFIPFKTGMVQINETYKPSGKVGVGYDEETNTYQSFNTLLLPEKFAKCCVWSSVPRLSEIFFNALARASGLNPDVKIILPHNMHINVPQFAEINTNDDFHDWENSGSKVRAGHGIYKGEWIYYKNGTVFDIVTNKELNTNVEQSDLTLYIPEVKSYRPANQFVFDKPFTGVNGTGSLNINLPTELDNENLGIVLFEALGIKYDVFDKVEYDKDGHIEDYSFAEGEHHFAVVKSLVYYIDQNIVDEIAGEYLKTDDGKKENKGFRTFDKNRLKNYFKNDDTPLFRNMFYLAVNQTLDKPSDKLLHKLTNFWKVTSLLRDIRRFKGELGKMDGNAGVFGPDDPASFKVTQQMDVDLLKTLIKSKEIYIPIFTPRFDNHVNAILSNINKVEPLHASATTVYLLNNSWNFDTPTIYEF